MVNMYYVKDVIKKSYSTGIESGYTIALKYIIKLHELGQISDEEYRELIHFNCYYACKLKIECDEHGLSYYIYYKGQIDKAYLLGNITEAQLLSLNYINAKMNKYF